MDDRMDLSPLDPGADGARFESLVAAVVSDAMAARAARPAAAVTLLELVGWSRPLLAWAAAIALVASAALFSIRPTVSAPESLAEAAGIPRAVAEWAARGEHPPAAELVAGFAGRVQP